MKRKDTSEFRFRELTTFFERVEDVKLLSGVFTVHIIEYSAENPFEFRIYYISD
jgi:hypothetical protein